MVHCRMVCKHLDYEREVEAAARACENGGESTGFGFGVGQYARPTTSITPLRDETHICLVVKHDPNRMRHTLGKSTHFSMCNHLKLLIRVVFRIGIVFASSEFRRVS